MHRDSDCLVGGKSPKILSGFRMLFWVRWIRLADTAAVRGGKPCAGAAAITCPLQTCHDASVPQGLSSTAAQIASATQACHGLSVSQALQSTAAQSASTTRLVTTLLCHRSCKAQLHKVLQLRSLSRRFCVTGAAKRSCRDCLSYTACHDASVSQELQSSAAETA